MRHRYLIVSLLLAVSACTSPAARFQKHIDYLASDRLEGRGLGSRGIELAGDYIADQFQRAGLEPGGDNGTYFQSFSLTLNRKLTGKSALTISGDDATRQEGVDFVPLSFSADTAFSGNVAFCGYGIVASEKNHDDYQGVDVSGRVVLILDGEPEEWTTANNNMPTRFMALRDKAYNAKDRGAVAILVYNRRTNDSAPDELPEFYAEHAENYGLPAFHISRKMAAGITRRAGRGDLDQQQNALDAGRSASALLEHTKASGQAVLEQTSASVRNVLGIYRGQGPSADQWIIIGAHYDHLGIRKPTTRRFKAGALVHEDLPPQIHNGADDNASGVSGLIEIANMLKRNPPQRSILIIAFTGEEAGLHGSKYFVEHPTVPLDSAIAMLNMDMIGRLSRRPKNAETGSSSNTASESMPANPHVATPNPHASAGASTSVVGLAEADGRVQVFGMDTGTGLQDIVDREARSLGLIVAPGVDEGGRSDHASFLRKNIPSLHFFSGNHPDYHQPSDDSYKINASGGARIASLVYHVAQDLADAPERPSFQIVKRDKKEVGGVTRFRVVMGLTPNYTDDGKPGMAVDGVSSEGPAELGGMKAGDRILSIGGKPVSNVYDYMAATRNNNPGDVVEVVVDRNGEKLTLKVTLSGAK